MESIQIILLTYLLPAWLILGCSRLYPESSSGLETLRAPAKMGQKLFQGGKAMDILDLRDKGSQRRDIAYREVLRLIRQLVEKVSYLLLYPPNSC